MGEYNPDRPYVLGMQWAPLVGSRLRLDTASEVGYMFRAASEDLDRVWVRVTSPPPGRATRKELVAAVYRANTVAGTGPARKLVIPCVSGELVTGGALVSAVSVEEAVANPSDQRYVTLTGPTAAARFWFGTTTSEVQAALYHRRILDVTVLYVLSGPFGDLSPAMTLGLERPSAGVNWEMDSTLTGPASHSDVTVVRRSRLGELNPWWSTNATPLSTTWRRPYSWAGSATPTSGLTAWSASGGTNVNVRMQVSGAAAAGAEFQLHYLALEVTYGEEDRVAAGGLDITNGAAQDVHGLYYDIELVQMYNFGYAPYLLPGYPYAVTVGQAHSGQASVASPVPIPVDRVGMPGSLSSLRGVLLRKTLREGSVPNAEAVAEVPAVTLYAGTPLPGTADGRSHSYLARAIATAARRHVTGDIVQRVLDDTAGTYAWIRFYARHLPGTRDELIVYQGDPTDPFTRLGPKARISVDEFDALPEVVDGWKVVTLRLDPPLVTTGPGAGAVTWWVFDTYADDESPWQILGATTRTDSSSQSSVNDTTYGGQTAFATIEGVDDLSSDLALMLVRDMDAVTGFAVQAAVQAVHGVDEHCARPVGGVPNGIHYHQLTWNAINSEVVAGWGSYEVQRQDDTLDSTEWETIALVGAPNVTAVNDYEARVGVESRYRIRMVHRIGIAGPWSASVAATIPVPGVTGTRVDVGVLILTSNHNPAGNLAYVVNPERAGEEYTFPEAGQVELQAMFGRDFRTAHRHTERGGVEFTRTLLVNAAAVPAQTLEGFRSLRDLAWDTVPHVCVRDEVDNRWLATLLVPGGSVRRRRGQGHVQLAQVTVVEVAGSPAPVDGGPPPCEGLRPEGTTASVLADALDPAGVAWSPVAVSHQFALDVAGGWGATETPGLAWQVTQGAATDVSASGGVGSIRLLAFANSNPYFETDTSGWQAFGGVISQSTAHAHQGGAAGLLTPDGVSATARAQSDQMLDVTVGQDVRAVAWVRCAVARAVILSIGWYDSAGVYLGTSTGPSEAVAANTWTPLAYTAAASLAGTARAILNVAMAGSPPASHLLYVDEAGIGLAPTDKRVVTGPNLGDVDVEARFRVSAVSVGEATYAYLMGRDVDGSDYYRARLAFRPDGTCGVALERIDGGLRATIVAEVDAEDWQYNPVTYTAGDWIRLRFQLRGEVVRAAAWADGTYWPGWAVGTQDGTYSTPGRTGVRAGVAGGSLTPAVTVDVDDYQVRTPMADVDIRAEIRTSGDLWNLRVEHYSKTNPEFISSGWNVDWSDAETCFEVFDRDVFYACAPTEEVVRAQRRWLRAVYEQNDGGGQGRLTFYSSLDGVTWGSGTSLVDFPEPLDLDSGFFEITVIGDITVSRVEIRNGVDGPLIVAPDFEAQPKSTKVFVDAHGASWEVDGVGICGAA